MIDPLVHVIIHVMLLKPQALASGGAHWYCAPGRPHTDVPVPEALIRGYERDLAQVGTVTEHLGFGTWTVGSAADADVAFEEGDHFDVRTRLSRARRFLPAFLHRLRIDLDQRETLAEILDGQHGPPSANRTRIVVTLPFAAATYATLARVHRIFGDGGRGGATQIAEPRGETIYTGATVDARPRIETALRHDGFTFTEAPETFVTDDAPACR